MSDIIDLEPYDNEPAELEVSEAVIEAVSPKVSTDPIEGGTRVTVTDIDGEKTFDVMDGEKGDPGDPGDPGGPGEPGQDGVSPTVTVTDITGGHRVTITDATGTHSFDVMNGEKGSKGDTGPAGPAGADYVLTAADKQEIAGMVLDDLPTWTGGAY